MMISTCIGSILLVITAASTFSISHGFSDFKCLETETQCADGCCPYVNGTCCSEATTCCRPGSICIGSSGVCLGLKMEHDKNIPSLYSEMATELGKVSWCPSDWTTCPYGCCRLRNAVCCNDNTHCCPAGYYCGTARCEKSHTVTRFLQILTKSPSNALSSSLEEPVPLKDPSSSKPGNEYQCNCLEYWECISQGGHPLAYCSYTNSDKVCCSVDFANLNVGILPKKGKLSSCGRKGVDNGKDGTSEAGEMGMAEPNYCCYTIIFQYICCGPSEVCTIFGCI